MNVVLEKMEKLNCQNSTRKFDPFKVEQLNNEDQSWTVVGNPVMEDTQNQLECGSNPPAVAV
jgi:hypothetical protein